MKDCETSRGDTGQPDESPRPGLTAQFFGNDESSGCRAYHAPLAGLGGLRRVLDRLFAARGFAAGDDFPGARRDFPAAFRVPAAGAMDLADFGVAANVDHGRLAVGAADPSLALVRPRPELVLCCVVTAFGSVFYWTCYHAFFATLGDFELRGIQLGTRQALGSIAGVLGPALGGIMLASFGPWAAFGTSALLEALATLPLIKLPEPRFLREAPRGACFGQDRHSAVLHRRLGHHVVLARLGHHRLPRAGYALRQFRHAARLCRAQRRGRGYGLGPASSIAASPDARSASTVSSSSAPCCSNLCAATIRR